MTPEELKSIRQSLGLSAQAFARLIGIAHGRTIFAWETGTPINEPSLILIEAIRDLPGFVDYLHNRIR